MKVREIAVAKETVKIADVIVRMDGDLYPIAQVSILIRGFKKLLVLEFILNKT